MLLFYQFKYSLTHLRANRENPSLETDLILKLTQCKPTRPILFSCLQNRATFQGLLRPLGLSKWPVTFVAVSTCQRGEGWKLYSLQLILFNSKHSCSRQERKKDKSHTYLKFRISLDRTPRQKERKMCHCSIHPCCADRCD